eukprot:5473782-Pyramimonas_sp.AAC.1
MTQLQGFNPKDSNNLKKHKITNTHMGGVLGNAMSCNVVEMILPRLLARAGLTDWDNSKCKWGSPKYNPAVLSDPTLRRPTREPDAQIHNQLGLGGR